MHVVVYDANGAGGDPGSLLRSIPIEVTADAGEVEACAVNVGLYLPAGGNLYLGVRIDPDGNVFVPGDDSAGTLQQVIRVSADAGVNWAQIPANFAVKALLVGRSFMQFPGGDWGSATVLDPATPLEVSGAVFTETTHIVALHPNRLSKALHFENGEPDDAVVSPVTAPIPGPEGPMPNFALGDVYPIPGTTLPFTAFIGGDFDPFAIEPQQPFTDTIRIEPVAPGADRHIELDTAVADGKAFVQTVNHDDQQVQIYARNPATRKYPLHAALPVSGLTGAGFGANRARIAGGVANPGALVVYAQLNGADFYDLRARSVVTGSFSPALPLATHIQRQTHPAEAQLIVLEGPDGSAGNDYPVYGYIDGQQLRAAVMEWRSPTIKLLGTVTLGQVPAAFSSFGLLPGASGSQLLAVHPGPSSEGELEIVDFIDFADSATWVVRNGEAPDFDGDSAYGGVLTETRLLASPGLPVTTGAGGLPGAGLEDAGDAVTPRAAPELGFPFLGPPGLKYQEYRTRATPCVKTAHNLCVSDRRFRVEARFRTNAGVTGLGQAVELTPDTGYFTFFDPDNVEIVLKVLNACAGNSHKFWTFAAGLTNVRVELVVTDTTTGKVRIYLNPQNRPFRPIQDTAAFSTCDSASTGAASLVAASRPAAAERGMDSYRNELPARLFDVVDLSDRPAPAAAIEEVPRAGDCVPNGTTLCLNDGRFEVKVDFETAQGQSGAGQAVELTRDTGYFWFFNDENVELVLKVLDACAPPFNHYWVFAAGLTNVEVDIQVTDTLRGAVRTYHNPQQTPFAPVQDNKAFPTCP
jgi:hypothetical protein